MACLASLVSINNNNAFNKGFFFDIGFGKRQLGGGGDDQKGARGQGRKAGRQEGRQAELRCHV